VWKSYTHTHTQTQTHTHTFAGEDYDLWKSCLRVSPLVFVREALVYWRIDSPDKLTQSNKE
jgi:hypothetical protein